MKEEKKAIKLRWPHIILPAAILALSVILTAVFYGRLPVNAVWLFRSDGSPERWIDRGTLVFWILGLQVLFLLIATGITRGIAGMYNRYTDSDNNVVKPGTVLGLMGNMVVLPQVIIFFAMIDIFSYNSYQTHFLPLWLNAIIVLLAGGIILGIFFLRAALQVWRANKE